jgi:hypothetical protein
MAAGKNIPEKRDLASALAILGAAAIAAKANGSWGKKK